MKTTPLATALLALVLAACHRLPGPSLTMMTEPPSLGLARGIDLPTDASDVLYQIRDNRLDFVARYYRDPTSSWPPLSPGEARRLSSLGVKIVAVWEPRSRHSGYFSYSSGYADALAAYGQAKAVGQPAGSAIYFAVDFDARSLAPIEQYFTGVAAGLAAASGGRDEYGIGVYGSGAVCEAVKGAGLARYSWLSNSIAWAGSPGYDGWDIRQGSRFDGLSFNHDADEARDEYGGFQLAEPGLAAPYPYAGAAPAEVAVPPSSPPERWLTTAIPPAL